MHGVGVVPVVLQVGLIVGAAVGDDFASGLLDVFVHVGVFAPFCEDSIDVVLFLRDDRSEEMHDVAPWVLCGIAPENFFLVTVWSSEALAAGTSASTPNVSSVLRGADVEPVMIQRL